MEFLSSFLLFLAVLFLVLCAGVCFVLLASVATGGLLACIATPIEAAIRWKSKTKRIGWTNLFLFFGMTSAFVWTLYSINLLITDNSPSSAEVRSALTFGIVQSNQPLPTEVVKTEIRRYKLVAMNPPKHFYVDLEDVLTKQSYERTYVGKHCNSYASNRLGDEYNISITTYKQGNRQWLQFNQLTSVFCS